MQTHEIPKALTVTIISIIVLLFPVGARAQTGTLSVTVHEPESTAALPCRAWVNTAGEQFFKPLTNSCTPYDKDQSFSCDGYFTIKLPPGKAVIHVERGKEYLPVEKEVLVNADKVTKVEIALRRWIDMSAKGWYSADIHGHFGVENISALKQSALADDINFEPVLAFWNHQQNIWNRQAAQTGRWPVWPEGAAIYADDKHLVTLRNQEIERIGGAPFESVGALLMLGLTKPVEIPAGKSLYPCDAVLAQAAKKSSPQCVIDTDKPIWGQNVVGVALGLFDSVQLCHNHYHRKSSIPVCCGMADRDVRLLPQVGDDLFKNNSDKDRLLHLTNSTYYRFLNCGFKLAATGGTAMGVMPAPLGYSRMYAKLDGPLTEANYLEAIRAGRTFATSGPILILTVNGLDVGTTIQYAANSKPIRARAQLQSIQPIDSLELIHNGKPVKKICLKDKSASPLLKQQIELSLTPQRSGWLAARATFTAPDGHLRQAHTSPVYILVDGKPIAFKQDAEYMISWIDRLLEVNKKAGRYNTESQRAEVEEIFRKARKIYERIAQTAAEQ